MAVRLAISGDAPPFSAVTYRLFAADRRVTEESALAISVNVSHRPTAPRLAIRLASPASSAQTKALSACARRAIRVPPSARKSYCSQGPIAVRLAISGDAPPFSATTNRPSARAFRLITSGSKQPVRSCPPPGYQGRSTGGASWLSFTQPADHAGRVGPPVADPVIAPAVGRSLLVQAHRVGVVRAVENAEPVVRIAQRQLG